MPRIFDNIDLDLLPTLRESINRSERGDFCVGYFNLRGWKLISEPINRWTGGEGACCRLLVGMAYRVDDELRRLFSVTAPEIELDNKTASDLRRKAAEEFARQLTLGAPSDSDEVGLHRLVDQLRNHKLAVKLFLRHQLHAKLYLLHRDDINNPAIGLVGSSNLTFAGLSSQGELNVDVLDHDACKKLQAWFNDRWLDRWCLDISSDLISIIENSWARTDLIPPYHIYLKIAYHLSQEARAGLTEFEIPALFGRTLFDFQKAAVKIAAHHLNKRGGVLLGDVVGLGKTIMACAVARIFEEDQGTETLIICPKNLVPMWSIYVYRYGLRAKVLSLSQVLSKLSHLERYRVVIIDESQNLRNRESKRFRVVQEYIQKNDCRCILLSATPYNKSYLDLSAQLRLFITDERDLGVRPENKIKEIGETEFMRLHQGPLRSLGAFEKSEFADDWRELMRLYLVRRTRSFVQDNYALTDADTGRKYLLLEDGTRSYFPLRLPLTVPFPLLKAKDQYAYLFSPDVVATVNGLKLPRYGLGNYVNMRPLASPVAHEQSMLAGLSRAGKRLMGFCRTNLFKRLESGGPAFIKSLERHILRNFVYIHAIEAGADLPIGTQVSELLETGVDDLGSDEDPELLSTGDDDQTAAVTQTEDVLGRLATIDDFRARAATVYDNYRTHHTNKFTWLRSDLFVEQLKKDLLDDATALSKILATCGPWKHESDHKLGELTKLVNRMHEHDKLLIFTQFADTVNYLVENLRHAGAESLAGVTGDSANPTALVQRFSPDSNECRNRVSPADELRVLVATDVLSEGQNLQDCNIVVNYDLPWALVRLIQRAGRVDRIGQRAEEVRCYSFLPAEGVEQIIGLRKRVRQRLRENQEVLGADETFFEDELTDQTIRDLFTEKAGILDGEVDTEVDLASYAYQIWKNAIDAEPALEQQVTSLPSVVYSSRAHSASAGDPNGVLVYVRASDGVDTLAWIDEHKQIVSQSQLAILRAAECAPDTPALPRSAIHHELVRSGVEHLAAEERSSGGQLGRPSGARFRVYERLKAFVQSVGDRRDLFLTDDVVRSVERAVEDIYRLPLRASATDTLNRQLKAGIADRQLAELVITLREDGRLSVEDESTDNDDPEIICSLGLFPQGT